MKGSFKPNNSGAKLITKLETIATLHANGVARFQLNPIATVGSILYLGRIYETRGNETRARQYYQRFVDYWGGGDIDEANVEHAEDFLDRTG